MRFGAANYILGDNTWVQRFRQAQELSKKYDFEERRRIRFYWMEASKTKKVFKGTVERTATVDRPGMISFNVHRARFFLSDGAYGNIRKGERVRFSVAFSFLGPRAVEINPIAE